MCVKNCCCVQTLWSWDVGHDSCDDMWDMTHVCMCWYTWHDPRVDVCAMTCVVICMTITWLTSWYMWHDPCVYVCAISRVLIYKKWPICRCFDMCGNYMTHVSIVTWPICVHMCAISRVLIYNTWPMCTCLYVRHDSRCRIRWNYWKKPYITSNTPKSPQKSPEDECKWVEQILKTGLSLAKD